MIKNILFDLDGTMLPMEQDEFVKVYFSALCKRFCPVLQVDKDTMIKAIWEATKAVILNNGEVSNCDKFWKIFSKIIGEKVLDYIKDFDDFYSKEFINVKESCGYNPLAEKIVQELKNKGYTLVVATNPIFPSVATNQRLHWAGLNKDDFQHITTYENSCYCKPNVEYYKEILAKLNLKSEESLMVGNDVNEDIIPTSQLGMENFLLTDCLINKDSVDISKIKQGSMESFYDFCKALPKVN